MKNVSKDQQIDTACPTCKRPPHCICSELSNMTPDHVQKLSEVLDLVKQCSSLKNYASSSRNEKKTAGQQNSGIMVELWEGSGVIVKKLKLECFTQAYKRKPHMLIRKLINELIPEEILKQSTPTGWGDTMQIDENIFMGVKMYVNSFTTKERYKLSSEEYRKIITSMCNQLRIIRERIDEKMLNVLYNRMKLTRTRKSFKKIAKDNNGNSQVLWLQEKS